jgi:hypothetical protein
MLPPLPPCSYANVRYLQVKFPLVKNYLNITGTPPLSVKSTFNMNDSNDTYVRAVDSTQHDKQPLKDLR